MVKLVLCWFIFRSSLTDVKLQLNSIHTAACWDLWHLLFRSWMILYWIFGYRLTCIFPWIITIDRDRTGMCLCVTADKCSRRETPLLSTEFMFKLTWTNFFFISTAVKFIRCIHSCMFIHLVSECPIVSPSSPCRRNEFSKKKWKRNRNDDSRHRSLRKIEKKILFERYAILSSRFRCGLSFRDSEYRVHITRYTVLRGLFELVLH